MRGDVRGAPLIVFYQPGTKLVRHAKCAPPSEADGWASEPVGYGVLDLAGVACGACGQPLVHGVLDAAQEAYHQPACGEFWRRGEPLDEGADLPAAIRRVRASGQLSYCAIRECIADLLAETLS